jgi:hypothetical protein
MGKNGTKKAILSKMFDIVIFVGLKNKAWWWNMKQALVTST